MSTAAVTPTAFTSVMGTGVIAVCAHAVAPTSRVLEAVAVAAWAASALLIAVLGTLLLASYARAPATVLRHLRDPAVAPFFGAVAMAILTVGTATLLVGPAVVGQRAAADVALALWPLGTVVALASATLVPFAAFTRHSVAPDGATPVWLLPVVAPMVAAAAGAHLVSHLGVAQARNVALACLAMFGATALASLAITAAVWNRLALHGQRNAASAPALFLILGPLGQSVTVAGLLADHAPESLGVSRGAFTAFSVLYGVPTLGFALLWLAIASAVVIDAARKGMRFSGGWWAFTFPVGTCVTASATLARHTHASAFVGLAWLLFALLLAGWVAAAGGTVRMLAAHFRQREWAPGAVSAPSAIR